MRPGRQGLDMVGEIAAVAFDCQKYPLMIEHP